MLSKYKTCLLRNVMATWWKTVWVRVDAAKLWRWGQNALGSRKTPSKHFQDRVKRKKVGWTGHCVRYWVTSWFPVSFLNLIKCCALSWNVLTCVNWAAKYSRAGGGQKSLMNQSNLDYIDISLFTIHLWTNLPYMYRHWSRTGWT